MREAGTVVYSNPLFKKEDIKTVQKKEQKKSDTPLTQYSKNAFVNGVRVNGTVNVSLRVHGNEKFLFVHTLTRNANPSTPVKWDITHNGKKISVGLLEPPLRSFFYRGGGSIKCLPMCRIAAAREVAAMSPSRYLNPSLFL